MDVLGDLLGGFANALAPQYLLYAAIGVTLGTLVGVLPGIGPALAVALLLPLTYGFDPTGAFIIFAGIYYGSLYGGAITSILLNTPGEAGSVATAIEGHPMAMAGRAGPALATAVLGSFTAGAISTLGLTFFAPLVANLARNFQATDYFALMLLAFMSVTALVGASIVRGMLSLFAGLFVGMVGLDFLTGQARFTFGIPELQGGVDIIIIAIGLFAIGEALYGIARLRYARDESVEFEGRVWLNREERRRVWKPWIRGGFLGLYIRVNAHGRLGGAHLPQLQHRETPLQAQRRVRARRHRRSGGPRGRQQRLLLRGAGSALDARYSNLRDGRYHSLRLPNLQPATWAPTLSVTPRIWSGRL